MNVVLTQPVEIALRTLSGEDRRQASAWIGRLGNWDKDPFVREHSHKLALPEDVYVLRTNTDMRIFFTLQQDRIVVLDIAKKATIVSSGRIVEHDPS
jgi:hypothetical protein